MAELLGYKLTTVIYIAKYIYEALQLFYPQHLKNHSFEVYKTCPGRQLYDTEAHTNHNTHSSVCKDLDV
jgi:hypothetical protein